jgi:hypothetical protein
MLVIDEPQSLPREVLDRLSQKADESRNDEAAYRQLLVLSATPRSSMARPMRAILISPAAST